MGSLGYNPVAAAGRAKNERKKSMNHRFIGSRLAVLVSLAAMSWAVVAAEPAAKVSAQEQRQLDRGRYLIRIAGCNDCHTAGYGPSGGKVPEAEWLKGDKLGWRGPWGTTYPSNLRLYMQKMSEDQWVKAAKAIQTRPPMPWFNLHVMADADLRVMYKFVRSLGAAGEPAPAYLPPDREPAQPFIQFPAPPQKR
jgi:mono/diheme cytochrome c family protein